MTSEEIRQVALELLARAGNHPEAMKRAFIGTMALIEDQGFVIPVEPIGFLSGTVPLRRFH